MKHWLKAEKVKERIVKIRRLFKKGRHLGSPNPERGRGAPRMCRIRKKRIVLIKYCGNVSYKYARIIYIERAYLYFTSFLCVRKLASSISAN